MRDFAPRARARDAVSARTGYSLARRRLCVRRALRRVAPRRHRSGDRRRARLHSTFSTASSRATAARRRAPFRSARSASSRAARRSALRSSRRSSRSAQNATCSSKTAKTRLVAAFFETRRRASCRTARRRDGAAVGRARATRRSRRVSTPSSLSASDATLAEIAGALALETRLHRIRIEGERRICDARSARRLSRSARTIALRRRAGPRALRKRRLPLAARALRRTRRRESAVERFAAILADAIAHLPARFAAIGAERRSSRASPWRATSRLFAARRSATL